MSLNDVYLWVKAWIHVVWHYKWEAPPTLVLATIACITITLVANKYSRY